MTVTYTAEVATCRGFGCFLKLLLRWRGSIYKLVWLDLSVFLLAYYVLNIVYRTVLQEDQKRVFEGIVKYCYAYSNLIPLSFVLGFYVSIVMTRWWGQYTSIPWPDPIAVFVSANVHGQDERGRVMRRTIMRYVCLCLTMVLSNVSPRVKKRFPTLDHLVDAGLLLENERHIMDDLNSKFPRHSKHWLPIVWAASVITRARKEGRIRDDFAVKTIIDELNKFRGQCGLLISYDTISVPLVYTQVVTLAVYSYFLTSVMGQQWVENKTVEEGYVNMIDLYFPIFTTLQFFFYMGWLKVAESLINPFGEDDDDFEVNWMLDRNIQVSYMIVDEMHHEHPELLKDQYWDEIFPVELPYTSDTERNREEHPEPSTAKIATDVIPPVPTSVKIDEMVGKSNQSVNYRFPEQDNELTDDNASGIHFTANSRPDRVGSAASVQSLAGSIRRVNTVTSALKRFFSREDSRPGSANQTEEQPARLHNSASSGSFGGQKITGPAGVGSIRLADQVIEEVDEQMTITSMRGQPETRPTAESIFSQPPLVNQKGPPPPSAPVDVPGAKVAYMRTQSATGHGDHIMIFPPGGVDALLSSSAPAPIIYRSTTPPGNDENDRQKMGSQESNISNKSNKTDEETHTLATPVDDQKHDDFDRLKAAREKERAERQMQMIAKTISSTQQNITQLDTENLIERLDSQEEELNKRNSTTEKPS